MWPSWRQQYDVEAKFGKRVSALNVNGPLVNKSIQIFGTKLALALHYYCVDEIIPPEGGVAVKWFTNWDRANNEIPPSLFTLLGEPKTLEQGDWSVTDQFEYAWVVTDCKTMAHYVSTFRQAFLVAGLVHVDAEKLHETLPNVDITRPGDWK